MREDGYTLAETLVVLAVIALAMGGLTAGVRVISLNQAAADRALAAARAVRTVSEALDGVMDGQGPFRGDAAQPLRGDDQGFTFDCAAPAPCGARLGSIGAGLVLLTTAADGTKRSAPLPGARQAHLVYVGSRTVGPVWPPLTAAPESLRAVVLVTGVGAAQAPMATARVWKDQSASCIYDPVSGVCRAGGS